jgi:6-phosphogluconolactonase (cycloisomerase 2 family)
VFSVDDSAPEEVRPRITPVQWLSTLPEDFTTTNYVGEIKISGNGRNVYVSNRGHHSIAVFSVDAATGRLSPVSIDLTGGKTPRHFGLSPCGSYAVVGNQDTDRVKIFGICPDTGSLKDTGVEHDLASPNFVLFQVPHPTREVHMEAPKDSAAAACPLPTAVTVSAY